MKILIPLLLSILLIAPINCANAQTITLNVDPSHRTVDIGEKFTVTINITNVGGLGLYSYELQLHFNKTLLNVTSATYPPGHFLEGALFINYPDITEANEYGYVLLAASFLGDVPGKTGSGILATVNFTGIRIGTSTLEIKEVTLLDPEGNKPTYTPNNGVVEVVPEFTLALLILAFLSLTLVTVMLRKRIRVHRSLLSSN